jgi:hypothetical protein
VDSLAADSDLIVLGTMGPEVLRHEIGNPSGQVVKTDAFHSFMVDEVLRGDNSLTGKTIDVGYWVDGPSENVTAFEDGDRLLLFLARYDVEGAPENTWVPLSSDTGVFDSLDSNRFISRGSVGGTARAELDLETARRVAALADGS